MEKEFLGGYSKGWWDSAKKNRALVRKYNTIDPQKLWEKYLLLKELLAQAAGALRAARDAHHEIEAVYSAALDTQALDALTGALVRRWCC